MEPSRATVRSYAQRLAGYWLSRSVRAKGLSVLAIPLVALLTVVGASLGLELHERAQRESSLQAAALTTATAAVLADAVDAETAVRGYAGTDDAVFLTPYTAAVTRLPDDFRRLRLAAGASGDGGPAAAIVATATDEFALLATLRASIRAGMNDDAVSTQLKSGKSGMDRLRGQAARLVDEPSRTVLRRRAAISRLEVRIEMVNIAGLGLGVLAGVVGIALFTSGISRRLATAASNADRLGRGVPLTPTAPSGDELGQLAASLTRAEQLLATRLTQLTAARDEALTATEVKNTFLSRTSHELRTPLNAILGFAQLLEMSELDEDDRDSTARILGAGRHLLALINELIDIARIEAGDLRLSVEPVRLATVVEEVMVLVGPLAAARSISISSAGGNPALAAQADHQRLKQVLINLISNAIKYNHDGGTIEVVCRPGEDDRVEVAVTDSGPGLSKPEIEQVFVPFERLGAERHGIEGTGIGLPLALSLTEAMRGELAVASSPGQGSTFSLRLPRAPDILAGTSGTSGASEVGGRRPLEPTPDRTITAPALRVLSIEDNSANSQVLARFLASRPGTTLDSAPSGIVGIDLVRRNRPDVVLLDLHLPGLSGEEVFAWLRREPATAGIPIIVLSADATPGTVRRLLVRGASRYLTKPLDLKELAGALDAVAGRLAAAPVHADGRNG